LALLPRWFNFQTLVGSSFNSPFYDRLPTVPGFGADVTAGEIGLGITAAVAGATVVHGIVSAVRDRMRTMPAAVPPSASHEPPRKA